MRCSFAYLLFMTSERCSAQAEMLIVERVKLRLRHWKVEGTREEKSPTERLIRHVTWRR